MLDLLDITKETKVHYIRHTILGQLVMYFRKRSLRKLSARRKNLHAPRTTHEHWENRQKQRASSREIRDRKQEFNKKQTTKQ